MSGLNLLYKLLLKEAAKGSGKASGIMSIGPDIRKITMNKYAKYVDSAKKQGVDLDKMSEQEIKYILQLNKPKGPTLGGHQVIDASSPEGQGITRDLFNMLDKQSGKNVIKTDFGKPFAKEVDDIADKKVIEQMYRTSGSRSLDEDKMYLAEFIAEDAGKVLDDLPIAEQNKFIKRAENALRRNVKQYQAEEVVTVDGVITDIKKLDPIESMKESNKVLKGEGRYKSLSKADREKIVNDESVTDHIFERNIEPDPEDFAQGGRTGSGLNYLLGEDDQNVRMPFKKGFSAGRRKFVQGIGALAALPIVGKYFKWAKPLAKSSKVLTSVPIKAGVDGMPLWFKPLVNRVIKEGDDVTKKFATVDRQIVHKSTLPDSQTDVIVTQNLDSGNVSVDIGMGKHGFSDGLHGQPVRLEYKASEVIEPSFTKNKQTINKAGKTKEEFWVEEAEFTGGHPENVKFEETISEKFGSHGSNFDEVEKFATGKIKKKTAKESIKAERAHWTPEGDMASGGRVPLGVGGIAGM